jgi:PASTA domain-containing protein
MSRIFAITAVSDRVSIGGDGRGEITFTVTNSSARPLRGRLRVRPLGSTKGEWLNIAGEIERNFSPNATQQVVVKVAPPQGAPAGKYQFRLDAVSVTNPDDDFTEGPTVDLEVKPTEAPKKPFPWRIVAAAAGAVVLIVGLTWLLWPGGVEVPDAAGLDVAEATKKFEELGFKVEVTRQPNSSVAVNKVFGQDPEGKSKAGSGSTITLFVAGAAVVNEVSPEPQKQVAVVTPTPAPTPAPIVCPPRTFRGQSEHTWVEFRLPQGHEGLIIQIPGGAHNKYVFPKCNRVYWGDLQFTCNGAGIWERTAGNWDSDAACHGSPGSSPYVAVGER